jgi:phage terminase small subunit
MNKGDKLSLKEEAFCRSYIETANASEAYRRSYNAEKMKPATINTKASLLLAKDKIRARIDELRAGHRKRHEVTVDRIVAELAKIAFANAHDFFEWGPDGVTVRPSDELTEDQRAVVCEVSQTKTLEGGTIRVKLSDKQAALEKLGKHLGMFADKGPAPTGQFVILDKPMSQDEWKRQFTAVGAADGAPVSAGALPVR